MPPSFTSQQQSGSVLGPHVPLPKFRSGCPASADSSAVKCYRFAQPLLNFDSG